jgi:peptide/nickel transport system substrate-binding protein
MRLKAVLWATCAPILALAVVTPVQAQKSKDTLRIAFYQPLRQIDGFYEAGPEATVAARMVQDNLVNYDNDKNEYIGGIATSWKQVDPLTMELKIRQDVKWSDGQPFTIDDVIYSFEFMMDPKAKYRFQDTRISWLGSFEKVGKDTIRIKAKEQMAVMLGKLTQFPYMLPKHIHAKLDKKEFFGNKPLGTGPYRVVELDNVTGALLARDPNYKHGNVGKPAGLIQNIRIHPVPDAQTQTARMLRGEQDLMYSVDRDLAESFSKNPDFRIHAEDSVSFNFLMFDVQGRSGNKVFTDKRVRQALMHAVDRDNLRQLVHPNVAKLPLLKTVCSPLIKYCDSSSPLPEYNPAKAKKLLTEAGYPDGFDMPILTWGEGKEAAEAVAGMWRKVGVRGSVESATFGAFIKKRAEGVPAIVTLWDNSVGQPDIDNTAEYYFLPNLRNYNMDKALEKLSHQGRQELDPAKRGAIYKELFNKSNQEAYLMPLNRIPGTVLHHKDLKLLGGHKHPYGFETNRVAWN